MYKEIQKMYFDPAREYPGITVGNICRSIALIFKLSIQQFLKIKPTSLLRQLLAEANTRQNKRLKIRKRLGIKRVASNLKIYEQMVSENKDKAFLAKDVIAIAKQQMETVK